MMRVGILLCLLSLASGDAPPPAVSSPHFLKKWISFLEGGDWEGGVCCLETFIVASRASDEPSLPSWAFQVWDPQLEAPGDEQRGVSPGWKSPPRYPFHPSSLHCTLRPLHRESAADPLLTQRLSHGLPGKRCTRQGLRADSQHPPILASKEIYLILPTGVINHVSPTLGAAHKPWHNPEP